MPTAGGGGLQSMRPPDPRLSPHQAARRSDAGT
uniref:Uncharacterized protein n=1 Tax=Arundo donax TaxID=35708 RepID=A0A0A9ARC3_ARUDO